MTLLIADDEELIRFTIKDMLEECGFFFDRILEASTGSQMISQYRKHRPEIALVDIRMPGKTGLDAMKELQEEGKETVWIILTGFADFEYARQALKLGADDYLLKPPSPEEMKKVLQDAEEKIRQERKRRHLDFERRLTTVFNNTSAPEFDPLFSEKGRWRGQIVCLDGSLPEEEALEVQTRFCREMREIFLPQMPEGRRGGLTTLENGKLLITIFTEPRFSQQLTEEQRIREEHLPVPDRKEISFSFLEVKAAENFRHYLKNLEDRNETAALRFLNTDISVGSKTVLSYCLLMEQLVLLAGTEQREEMEEIIQALLERSSPFQAAEEKRIIDNLGKIIPDFPIKEDLASALSSLKGSGESEHPGRQSVLVQQAMRIIREDYSQDIGIAQIAYKLQVTPNYLSSLFRKHSGIPFTRYITEIRMNRARRLLKGTNLNIKEISSQVGYQSSRHFSGLFRQETGISPTEYIRKYRR